MSNPLDTLDEILNRVIEIDRRLERIEHTVGVVDVYTVKDLCTRYGFSTTSAHRFPWKLPRYGASEFGSGVKRWKRETVEAWYAIDESEHRREWETMSADDRMKMLGAA